MINQTIDRIENKLAQAQTLAPETKADLLTLVHELRVEVSTLAGTHDEHASSIAGFAEMSTHEATREQPDKRLMKLSLEGLAESVRDFEATHPRLSAAVNSIHQILTNIGLG